MLISHQVNFLSIFLKLPSIPEQPNTDAFSLCQTETINCKIQAYTFTETDKTHNHTHRENGYSIPIRIHPSIHPLFI